MINSILIATIFCSLISAYLLFFKTTNYQIFSNRLFAFLLIFASYGVLLYLLVITGELINYPYLYKTAAPIVVFNAPISYLYIRSILKNENKFRKYDLLHFLPVLLIFLNYLPFYFSSNELKFKYILPLISNHSENVNDRIGLVPEFYQYLFRFIQNYVYLFLQWKLLIQINISKSNKNFAQHARHVIQWIKVLNWLWTISLFTMTILLLLSINGKIEDLNELVGLVSIIMSVSFCFTGCYLLLHPDVLFGMPYLNSGPSHSEIEYNANEIINTEEKSADKVVLSNIEISNDYHEEITKINNYFEDEAPYLNMNITINEVAVALKIPVRDVSFILNQHYKQRFTDFINFYRIQFVNQEIQKGVFTEYTINSIANNAGFSSDSSFYRAFKKVNQCTPSEYIYKLKHPN